MRTYNMPSCFCLELIFMVPKVFEPLKFDCIWEEVEKSTAQDVQFIREKAS